MMSSLIDKHKSGYLEETKIYPPSFLETIEYDYIVIATTLGKAEVEKKLKNKGLIPSEDYFYGYGVE